jgi:DNA modification methylase
MCGDSTNKEDVALLMDGEQADMVFTDPPYNINYSGIKDKRTIKNDKMQDKEFVEFLKKSLIYCDTSYICCSWQYAHLFKEAMTQLNMSPKAMIIWNKVNPAQNLDKYYKQHEIIWYYGKFGGEKTIRGDIWECKRQKNTLHPTMKPIELISMAIQDNPNKQNIYDGFGGSGSTLIACEQLNRRCYMIELEPVYCQIIINRWEDFTGRKAEKLPL